MKVLLLAAALALTGCATNKEWVATGGSRSDGVVRLSFDYGGFEQPKLDEYQGVRVATQRCAVWGYTGAEPFGGARKQCNANNAYGCVAWTVTKEYQCTGSTKPPG